METDRVYIKKAAIQLNEWPLIHLKGIILRGIYYSTINLCTNDWSLMLTFTK
jgi:hypothetical protein